MRRKSIKVILIGAFHETIELCEHEKFEIIGIIDNIRNGTYKGYQILGSDRDAADLHKTYGNIPVIVSPDQPVKRYNIVELYLQEGYHFINLVSSNSLISNSATVGKGVVIQSFVNISTNVILEDFVRVNTMANIMHDSRIKTYVTVAPNAVILGNVTIGSFSYIGSNATILPGINIGNNAVIGAGSVVTKDVGEGKTVAGNPARELQSK